MATSPYLLLGTVIAFLVRVAVQVRRFAVGRTGSLYELSERDVGTRPFPSKSLSKGAYTRLLLVPRIVTTLPQEFRPRGRRLVPATGDVLSVAALLVLGVAGPLTDTGVAIAVLLFAITPQSISRRHPPATQYSPKRFAVGWYTLSIAFTILGVTSGAAVWYVGAIGAGAIVWLSDRALLVVHAFTMVLFGVLISSEAIVLLTVCLVVAVLVGRRSLVRTLLGLARLTFDVMVKRPSYRQPNGFGPFSVDPVVVVATAALAIGAVASYTVTPVGDSVVQIGTTLWLVGAGVPALSIWAVGVRWPETVSEVASAAAVPAALLVGTGVSYTPVLVVGVVSLLLVSFGGAVVRDPVEPAGDVNALSTFFEGRESDVVVVQPAHRAPQLSTQTGVAFVSCLLNEESSLDQLELLFPDTHLLYADVAYQLNYYFNPDWLVIDREFWRRSERPVDGDELSAPEGTPAFETDQFAVYPFDDVLGD